MPATTVTMFADEAAAFKLFQESMQTMPEPTVSLAVLAQLPDAEVESVTAELVNRRRDEALCVELAVAAGLLRHLPRLIAGYAQAYADSVLACAEQARRDNVAA